MSLSDVLDEPDHSLDRGDGVLLQTERECEIKHYLGVRGPGDAREEFRVDREEQVTANLGEFANAAVMRPQPVTAPERVAVGLLDWGPGGRRTCARNSGDRMCRASSPRFASAQAGWTLRNKAGTGSPSLYQPTPKPSALRAVAPIAAALLWWMSEFVGLDTNVSSGIDDPEYASQRHMTITLRTSPLSGGCGRGGACASPSTGDTRGPGQRTRQIVGPGNPQLTRDSVSLRRQGAQP